MKLVLLIFMTFLLPVVLCAQAQKPNDDFNTLFSLVGIWEMQSSKGNLYESWEKLNDSTLKGFSYRLDKKDTVILENVELVKRNTKIQYIPVAKGQNNNEAISFTLLKNEKGIYTFENTTHDFPQRIVYVVPQNDLMHAWIEGEVNGKFKKIDYNYTKIQ